MTRPRSLYMHAIAGVGSIAGVCFAFQTTLYEGAWRRVYAQTDGSWKIVGDEYGLGERTLELSADFKTEDADALKIYLSPKRLDELTDLNATDDARLIADLESASGAQAYEIPSDVELEDYKSIIIHNEPLGTLWCGSSVVAKAEERVGY